jgi:hypothetical protein
VSTATLALTRVPGFENTHYALLDGRIVWTGETAHSDHPRNLANPWQARPCRYPSATLRKGAALNAVQIAEVLINRKLIAPKAG